MNIVEKITGSLVKYCVVGEETGETGTLHLQGYVRFSSVQRMTGVKKIVGLRAHVETCRGSEEENKLYCTKDGKVLLEVGIYNTSIGRRGCPASMGDNVIALIDFLKSGKKVYDIAPEHYLTFVHKPQQTRKTRRSGPRNTPIILEYKSNESTLRRRHILLPMEQ